MVAIHLQEGDVATVLGFYQINLLALLIAGAQSALVQAFVWVSLKWCWNDSICHLVD